MGPRSAVTVRNPTNALAAVLACYPLYPLSEPRGKIQQLNPLVAGMTRQIRIFRCKIFLYCLNKNIKHVVDSSCFVTFIFGDFFTVCKIF